MNSVAKVQSNVDPVLNAHFEEIARLKRIGSRSSFASLEAHAGIGRHLTEVKPLVPHGYFEDEIQARFGFTRQWSSRLQNLGRQWDNVPAAIEWAKSKGEPIRPEFSVDRMLALLARWGRRNPETEGSESPAGDGTARPSASSSEPRMSRASILKLLLMAGWELARAYARIAFLEAEIERLRANESHRSPPAPLLTDTLCIVVSSSAEDRG